MRAYLSVFRLRFRMETHYRGAVLGGVICQIFFGLILIALYRALYAGAPQSRPFESVAAYVWLQQAFFRMLLSSDAELIEKIRTGGIAYDLLRPLDLYCFYYVRILAQKWMGSLLRALPMLVFALLLPRGWGLSAPSSLTALGLSVLSLGLGLLCVCALENITMAFTMKTLDQRGIQAVLNLLMMLLAGNVLPLTLYPDSWQKVLTLLPYAQLLDAPIRLYSGEAPLSAAAGVMLLQALWSALLIALGMLLWHKNQRHLVLQGG